jgi:hypothetical protein
MIASHANNNLSSIYHLASTTTVYLNVLQLYLAFSALYVTNYNRIKPKRVTFCRQTCNF